MKKLYLFLVLLVPGSLFAQNSRAAKSLMIEVGGPSLLAGISYDTRFLKVEDGFGIRLGVGVSPTRVGDTEPNDDPYIGVTFPIQLNYLLGGKGHYFEAGAGATMIVTHDSQFGVTGTLTLGYRFQPIGKHIVLRAGATPLVVGKIKAGQFPVLPYISVGYRF